jgi:hypothetical protein
MSTLRTLALTYKTFPATLPAVHEATIDVLRSMGMQVRPLEPHEASAHIQANGWRRQVDVELEAQGFEETRVRIVARDAVFFEENPVTQVIAQVTRRLEHRN